MDVQKLSNIDIKDLRRFLRKEGVKIIRSSRGRGGHEKWSRKDFLQPITLPTHVNPVAEFIVKQVLRRLKMDRKTFSDRFKSK